MLKHILVYVTFLVVLTYFKLFLVVGTHNFFYDFLSNKFTDILKLTNFDSGFDFQYVVRNPQIRQTLINKSIMIVIFSIAIDFVY
jgi:hypothetical protein